MGSPCLSIAPSAIITMLRREPLLRLCRKRERKQNNTRANLFYILRTHRKRQLCFCLNLDTLEFLIIWMIQTKPAVLQPHLSQTGTHVVLPPFLWRSLRDKDPVSTRCQSRHNGQVPANHSTSKYRTICQSVRTDYTKLPKTLKWKIVHQLQKSKTYHVYDVPAMQSIN